MRIAVLFAFGLVLRLLFESATPDGGACWHVGFQGDAPVWQDLAWRLAHGDREQRLAKGVDDIELSLPLRPPGMLHLVAAMWNGEGATAAPVRLALTVLGAAIAPLVWLLLRRHVAVPVAWCAAVLCAASSNLLLLSSGLHVETPYLVLLLLALLVQQQLTHARASRAALAAVVWGLLHAALCLLRAEHLPIALVLVATARVQGAAWRTLLLAVVAAAGPLVPWQLHVNRAVAAFNRGEPRLPPSDMPWNDAAYDALRALPAFQQPFVFEFVGQTVRVRGGREVRVGDLEVVREAYGVFPEPMRTAFVALQGAHSFWLANTPEANGGHSRMCLDREPPLHGGDHLYPAGARSQRPRGGTFRFAYPPHADVFVNGYRRGIEEIAADPLGAVRRLGIKLQYTIQGATGGVGGYALPIGMSGVRPSVDLVIATGFWPGVWRALVLVAAVAGCWRLRRVRALWPLFAIVPVRVALIAAFFGHARHGALLVPVTALGVAAALHAATAVRWPRLLARLTIALMVALTAIETVRANAVTVAVDGRPWLGPAGGEAEHKPHTITFH